MVNKPAVELGQLINPDQIARIEISRSASVEGATVRVFAINVSEPYLFEFGSMAAAIEFYEQLWSRRSACGGKASASHSA